MDRALTRLERVLELERQQGYQNKAVVGGIRQFAVYWVTQATEEATDEADLALAEQVSEVLMEYGRLSGVEARAQAIGSLLAGIERRRARRPARDASPWPANPLDERLVALVSRQNRTDHAAMMRFWRDGPLEKS